MSVRWTKLRETLRKILRTGCDLRLSVYRMQSQHGSTDLPRYSLVKDGVDVWTYPDGQPDKIKEHYPYYDETGEISSLIRKYINCPRESLKYLQDKYGLFVALRKLDRRLSLRIDKELRYSMPRDRISSGDA